ncbi:hypothetical protein GBA63_21665 (plasmid) [Rubrobacter tropicus]|uniref:Uncharacterized protein n=1 Tax=Rubrobacter tropicus TaxID=2653851 RepID=A0A6G8QFR0_9ACTN|nr:hypothetical protein [Rubrobacter tropicus]QIN85329.1 hypothetical protein GBA63_21665 [Rubrobacter tropicus]
MMDPFSPRGMPRRPGSAPRRSKSWILLVFLALLLIVGYALAVAWIGGGRAGEAGQGNSPAAEQGRADAKGGGQGGGGEGAADERRGEGDGRDLPLTAPGDDDRGEPNPDGAATHEHEKDVFVYEPEGSDRGPGPGGAEGEPGAHDPLGRGTDGPVLSETQLERAELAVSNYVTAVYGYTGDDFNEYQKKVGEAVVFPGFFSTPGAEHVREVQRQIEQSPDGVTNGAVLNGFTAEEQTDEQIKGVAYFEVGDEIAFSETAARGVELRGETTRYAQPVNLQLYGPQWRVTAAGQRQEVTD